VKLQICDARVLDVFQREGEPRYLEMAIADRIAMFKVPDRYDPDLPDSFCVLGVDKDGDGLYLYRRVVVSVPDAAPATPEEIAARVKHRVIKHLKKQARLRREIECSEKRIDPGQVVREKIPRHVQLFVWQRDQGKCVMCGSRANLEFDHIIPVAKGGSSTERNVQLLCELCNRAKSDSIGGPDPPSLFRPGEKTDQRV
jgi:hypothetical protein